MDIVVLLTENYWSVSGRARSSGVFESRFTSVQSSFSVCVVAAFRITLEAIFPTFPCTTVHTLFMMKWRVCLDSFGFHKRCRATKTDLRRQGKRLELNVAVADGR